MRSDKSGMTLVEVLLAALLLGIAMAGIFTCLSRCMGLVKASMDVHNIKLAFDLADFKYPVAGIKSEDDFEKVEVDDIDLSDLAAELGDENAKEALRGYRFSRKFDEKLKPEDENAPNDHLFVCRSVVSWGSGEDDREEHVEYFYLPDVEEHTGL